MNSQRNNELFSKEIKEILKELNFNYDYQVISKLSYVAQTLATETLKDARFYSSASENVSKDDVLFAIKMKDEHSKMCHRPNDDALIDAAVAINGKPIIINENFGLALPKKHLGNCNYQLSMPSKKLKVFNEKSHPPPNFLKFFSPYKENQFSNFFVKTLPKSSQSYLKKENKPIKITINGQSLGSINAKGKP